MTLNSKRGMPINNGTRKTFVCEVTCKRLQSAENAGVCVCCLCTVYTVHVSTQSRASANRHFQPTTRVYIYRCTGRTHNGFKVSVVNQAFPSVLEI